MIEYKEDKELDGKQLFHLFTGVGWIKPVGQKAIEKPVSDAIANQTFYRDDDGDYTFVTIAFRHSTYVVSEWDGTTLVGVLRVLSDTIHRSILYDFAVLPAYQGQGIGKELITRCVQRYEKTQITLGTSAKNFPFYQRFGFTQSHNYMERVSEYL